MRCSSFVLSVALVLFTATAGAQDAKALAKEAYDRGTQAHGHGDFRRAAEEFARADALAPSPVALQAALDAAVDADDFLLGAELLERSKRAKPTGALAASIEEATKKLAGRAGRVKVACPSGARCTTLLDGAAFDAAKGTWQRPGPHTLVVRVDGGTADTRTVEVRAGEDMEVVAARGAAAPVDASPAPTTATTPAPAPAAQATPPAGIELRSTKALSPVVFGVAAGVTVALAGVTTLFAVKAKGRYGDFTDAGCDKIATDACVETKDSGEQAQTFANIGFAATAVAGMTTVVIAAFFTDWGGSGKAARGPIVVPLAGGMAAGWTSAF